MKGKKSVLIVTDGTKEVTKMAEDIAAALKGNKVLLKGISSFVGNDLLQAEFLFFGCKEPAPPSFKYFEDLLQHINLAGRPLGIFSPGSTEAVQYLSRLVKDSEAALFPEPFFAGNVEKWAAGVLTGV